MPPINFGSIALMTMLLLASLSPRKKLILVGFFKSGANWVSKVVDEGVVSLDNALLLAKMAI